MGSGSSHDLNASASAPPPTSPSPPPVEPIKEEDNQPYEGDIDMELVGKTLANVLHDNICIEYFALHLANEHSSENLDFYESVDHFHHEWDVDHKSASVNIAKKIWQLYVASNAPLAVNLPSKIRIASEKKIIANEITRDVFDVASNEIYNVMNRDSFSRFKMSPLWLEYCAHPDRHPDGVPPPAVTRLADCYTGRRNSETLMSHVGKQEIDEVLRNPMGLETFQNFMKVESPLEGTESLLVYVGLKEFNKYIESLGIPTDEDKLDVGDHIKGLLEKVKKAKNLPEYIQVSLNKVNETLPAADIKGLCTIFSETESLCRQFLSSDTFEKFLNSALYIKYRMHVMKEESLNASMAATEEKMAAIKKQKSSTAGAAPAA